MHTGEEATFCRYIFFFEAADCGECPDESRRIVFYSFVDRTTKSDQDNAFWKTIYLWLQFWLYTPFMIFFNLQGDFGFTDRQLGDLMYNKTFVPFVKSQNFYINDPEKNKQLDFQYEEA